MKIEFHPVSYKPFVREIPLPLPQVIRVPTNKGGSYATSLEASAWPPQEHQIDYIEFELDTVKHENHPNTNVFFLPRRAYKEVRG